MNKKGFAISTLIYGLSIMGIMLIAIIMGTMSSNRNNTKEISQSIEQELISFSKTETTFTTSSTIQDYVVADGQSGFYRIELWGAQGGNTAYGAYTTGIISLTEGDVLYFNIGKMGSTSVNGQSTDVRIVGGSYEDPASYNSRIMVAAGGGIGSGAAGGTLLGYNSTTFPTTTRQEDDGSFKTSTVLIGTKKYSSSSSNHYNPTDLKNDSAGVLGPISQNGGGSGYYSSKSADVGGTSFIAGYAGSGNAISDPENASRHYYFIDGVMFGGVNAGDGKAKITKVLDNKDNDPNKKLPRRNNKLDKVKAIRDCLIVTDNKNHEIQIKNDSFKRIVAMKDGFEVAGSLSSAYADGNRKCKTLTLNAETAVDEIAVWHEIMGVDYYNHTIEVQKQGGTSWTEIKKKSASTDLSETEVATGYHISAYQPDMTTDLPATGNYLIIPVLTENRAITAQANASDDQKQIESSYINGQKTQIWSIELLDDKLRKKKADGTVDQSIKEYKIVELARYKSMSLQNDENKIKNEITASTSFNNYARNDPQIWIITPLENGTYSIKTIVPSFYSAAGKQSGYIVPNTTLPKNPIMIGKNDLNGQRFRFISQEYTA